MSVILTEEQEGMEREHSQTSVREMIYKGNQKKSYLFIKRAFDILASVTAGIILLLPMLIVAILILLDSPGPVFYTQERLSKNGKPYKIYKFY